MKYHTFLEDVATADVAFEVNAPTLKDLFESAALATMEVMTDPKSVASTITKKITLTADTLDMLLYTFLEELIFLKDSESLLFHTITCHIKDKTLEATLTGEHINPKKHKLGIDVKAVTLHKFTLKKTRKGYYALIILDI